MLNEHATSSLCLEAGARAPASPLCAPDGTILMTFAGQSSSSTSLAAIDASFAAATSFAAAAEPVAAATVAAASAAVAAASFAAAA